MGNQDVPKMMTMAINILFVLLVLASSSILFFADLEQEYFNIVSFVRIWLRRKRKLIAIILKETFFYKKYKITVSNNIITFIWIFE